MTSAHSQLPISALLIRPDVLVLWDVMSVTFAADDVPVAARSEYWRHVLGDALVPLDPVGLPERVVVGQLGPVAVGELSHAGPGGARRTARHVRCADPGLCKIDLVARGHGVIEQGGREAQLQTGDLALVDLSRPATWAMTSVRCVVVIFPRSLLPLGADDIARVAAMRIPGRGGTGELISSLGRRIPAYLDGCTEANGARLGAAILDLITVALAERLDRTVPAATRQRALLERIYAFVEARLDDPALSPEGIAAAQFISVRYLHKLFETQETTVANWIRRRRLERCRRALLDPALHAEPVSAIAARWGLGNPARFSRLFRTAYGVTPQGYRAAGGNATPRA
jgi:AraC-like DNA-binding protein